MQDRNIKLGLLGAAGLALFGNQKTSRPPREPGYVEGDTLKWAIPVSTALPALIYAGADGRQVGSIAVCPAQIHAGKTRVCNVFKAMLRGLPIGATASYGLWESADGTTWNVIKSTAAGGSEVTDYSAVTLTEGNLYIASVSLSAAVSGTLSIGVWNYGA